MAEATGFEAFLHEYQDMVFATAVRLLGSPAEAEDVAQTVFLKAFERCAEVGPNPGRAGWLKTVTTNLCLNHLTRYRARWQFFSELEGDDGENQRAFAESLAAPDPVADDPAWDDRSRSLERALRRLPDHQRVPLVLFHFEDRNYQEIATLLGVSLGKVRTDIHRGRERLKKALTDRT